MWMFAKKKKIKIFFLKKKENSHLAFKMRFRQDDCGASLNQANSKVDFKRWGNELVAHVSTGLAALAADKMPPSLTFFYLVKRWRWM